MANMSTVPRALAHDPYPSTPAFPEDMQFLAAYLGIHMLSVPSRRYAYLLWAFIGLVFIVVSLSHVLGARGGVLGAYWSKFALRRRAWKTGPRSRRRTLLLLPSNGQIIALTLLFACIATASCVGPDYIIPTASTFDLSRRSFFTLKWDPAIFVSYAPQYTIQKAWWTAGGRVGMIAFSLFPLCILFALKAPPFALFSIPHLVHLSFDKLSRLHRWTGWLIWILSALHVSFWSVQLWNDRRPNVFSDSEAVEKRVYGYAWSYYRFIFAWGAFSLFTLLMLSTLSPLRRNHYETFYFFHIVLVPATIVLAALHHPPLWQWCWAALGIWVAERTWRLVRWTWINGVIGKHTLAAPVADPRWSDRTLLSPFDSENGHSPGPNGISPYTLKNSLAFPMPSAAPSSIQASVMRQDSLATGRYPPTPFSPASPAADPRRTSFSSDISTTDLHSPMVDGITAHMNLSYTPPPGYAHAELLAGHTIRLTLTPARQFSWAPGQHFLLLVPHVSSILTHPFTTASCYDKLLPDQEGALVFLIRAKAGWTRELWNTVAMLSGQGQHIPPGEQLPQGWAPPKKGVVMRALVDGPFGSSGRVRWDNYSTAIICVGGSGISFGLSVLEHLCLRMAGRDAVSLAGKGGEMKMRRVRFIWLIREYSHLQWCSSAIRRCMEALPFPALQLDIFVTNAAPETVPRPMHPPALDISHSQPPQNTLAPSPSIPLIDVMSPASPSLDPIRPVSAFPSFVLGNDPDQSPYIVPGPEDVNHLRPPKPGFARNAPSWMRGSLGSTKSASTGYSAFDLSYYQRAGSSSHLSQLAADAEDMQREEDQEIDDIADLTNWDGENDSGLTGESRLSRQIMKAGNKRRLLTFRNSMAGSTRDSAAGDLRASTFSNGPQGPGLRPESTAHSVRFSAGLPADHGHHMDHGRLIHGRSGLSASHAAHSRTSLLIPSPIAEGSTETSDDDDGASTVVHSRPGTPTSAYDARSSIASSIGLIPGLGPGTGHRRTRSEAVAVEVEKRELRELARVAEFAHPGKPNIHAIIREEVEHSAGAIVVGVCGPITLNTVVRKAVAKSIQPGRLWRGDERGRVDLISEDFEY